MKVLWFSQTASNEPGAASPVAFRGLVSSLENGMKREPGMELGVAYFATNGVSFVKDSTHYYPMMRPCTIWARFRRFFDFSGEDERTVSAMQKVVEEFQPDIIQVFGTEVAFGLFCERTSIPVVIHLQGLMVPYIKAWFPPGYSVWDLIRARGLSPWKMLIQYRNWKFNCHAAARERRILKACRYFMGRTEWDHEYCALFAPQARYFHCEEMLRPAFRTDETWTSPSRPVLVSTLSGPLYKGHDLILQTAKVLIESGLDDFEWHVFGVSGFAVAERKTGIHSKSVHVFAKGSVPPETLKVELLSCSVYVHPSYIDNSPNSVCEAQVLGVPVVATAVGGVPSLFVSSDRDRLVPPNDPIAMAFEIRKALSSERIPDTCPYRKRHDPSSVVATLRTIYGSILGENIE